MSQLSLDFMTTLKTIRLTTHCTERVFSVQKECFEELGQSLIDIAPYSHSSTTCSKYFWLEHSQARGTGVPAMKVLRWKKVWWQDGLAFLDQTVVCTVVCICGSRNFLVFPPGVLVQNFVRTEDCKDKYVRDCFEV